MREACPAAGATSVRPPGVRRAAAGTRRCWSCVGLLDPPRPAWLVRACIVVSLVAGARPEEARAIWRGGRQDRCSAKEAFPSSSRLQHALMPRSARLRRSVGWRPVMMAAVGPARARGVGAAQRAGQPVPACHAPGQVRGVGGGHPGLGDEQRAHRGIPAEPAPVGRRAEPGRGHPGHRDAGLGVDMGPRPGRRSGSRSAYPPAASRPGPLRPARTARCGGGSRRQNTPGRQGAAWGTAAVRPASTGAKAASGGRRGCRPGPAGAQVMHVHGHAQAAVRGPAGVHILRMPEPRASIETLSGPLPAPVRSKPSRRSRSVIACVEHARAYPPDGRIVSANLLQSWRRITDLRSRKVGGYPPVQAGRLMHDESQRLAEFASRPGGHREGQDMTVRV